MLLNQAPRYYYLEILGRNYSEQVVYVSDHSLCEDLTLPCSEFSVDNSVVDLAFVANESQV